MNLVQVGSLNTFLLKMPDIDYTFPACTQYDSSKTYSKDTVFIINDFAIPNDDILALLENGHTVIVDAVWEGFCKNGYKLWQQYPETVYLMYCGTKNIYNDCNHVFLAPNYFWIHEYLFNKQQGLDQYIPQRSFKKQFLAPMRTQKTARDMLYSQLEHFSSNAIISYVDRGIELPMDDTHSRLAVHRAQTSDRDFNSMWYDDTHYSVVSETEITATKAELRAANVSLSEPRAKLFTKGGPIFLTEKTFKPIAFEHPFLIFGQAGTIARLKQLGFATFDYLFNEKYDEVESAVERLEKIIECNNDFNIGHYLNPLTADALAHNRALFYNKQRVIDLIEQELITPLREIYETT